MAGRKLGKSSFVHSLKWFVFNDALTQIDKLKGHMIDNDIRAFGSVIQGYHKYKDA